MALTNERYHIVTYDPSHTNRATLSFRSNCGPIQISVSQDSVRVEHFRPQSPLYNVPNSTTAGNLIIKLRESVVDLRDIIAVTFTNNSTVEGEVALKLALNFPVPANQERLDFADSLAAGASLSVHIVINNT